jgi:hypothetical protein
MRAWAAAFSEVGTVGWPGREPGDGWHCYGCADRFSRPGPEREAPFAQQRYSSRVRIVDGALDLDAAVDVDAARIKHISSPVVDLADVLIAPKIEAGNTTYKNLAFMVDAQTAGLVVGGSPMPDRGLLLGL